MLTNEFNKFRSTLREFAFNKLEQLKTKISTFNPISMTDEQENKRIVDALNDITAESFPDHRWGIYGGKEHGYNFRLVHKSVQSNQGDYYENNLTHAQGYALFYAFHDIGAQTDAHYTENPLTYMRIGGNSVTSTQYAIPTIRGADLNFLEKHADIIKFQLDQHVESLKFNAPHAAP